MGSKEPANRGGLGCLKGFLVEPCGYFIEHNSGIFYEKVGVRVKAQKDANIGWAFSILDAKVIKVLRDLGAGLSYGDRVVEEVILWELGWRKGQRATESSTWISISKICPRDAQNNSNFCLGVYWEFGSISGVY